MRVERVVVGAAQRGAVVVPCNCCMQVQKKTLFFVSAVLAIFVLVLLAFLGYTFLQSQRQSQDNVAYRSAFTQGDAARRNGSVADAEHYFAQALALARTPQDKAKAQLFLGIAEVNDPAKVTDGLSILEDVANTDTYQLPTRASALVNIAQWLNSATVYSQIETYFASSTLTSVYTDAQVESTNAPWSSILKTAQAKRGFADFLAVRKVFDRSNDIYQNYLAEYWVAAWYAGRAVELQAQGAAYVKDRDTMVAQAQAHLAAGDAVYQSNIASGYGYATQVAFGNGTKAQAALRLYSIDGKESDLIAAQDAARGAIIALSQDTFTEKNKNPLLADVLYFYAISLALDNASNQSDLTSTVARFVAMDAQSLAGRVNTLTYLNNPKYNMRNSSDWKSVVILAHKSPVFANFLLAHGWTAQDLK